MKIMWALGLSFFLAVFWILQPPGEQTHASLWGIREHVAENNSQPYLADNLPTTWHMSGDIIEHPATNHYTSWL